MERGGERRREADIVQFIAHKKHTKGDERWHCSKNITLTLATTDLHVLNLLIRRVEGERGRAGREKKKRQKKNQLLNQGYVAVVVQ